MHQAFLLLILDTMKIDINILLDKIHGKLDDRKELLFESWLNSDSRHRVYFEKLEQRELSANYNETELPEEKWLKYRQPFINKITQVSLTRKNQKRKILYAASAAAIILLILSIKLFTEGKNDVDTTSIFTEVLNKIEKKESVSFVKIPKVSNKKVQLITAKGEKISLLEMESGKAAVAQSFQLSDDKTALTYTSTNVAEKAQGLNTLLVNRGAEFRIILSDGTKIHLNSDSKLEYPTIFNDKERKVYLKGEAYFEVARDESKPFIVCVGSTEIKVLGTVFNINSRKPESIRTTLVTGSVSIKSAKTEEVQLKPGYTAIVNTVKGSLDIDDKDIQCYIGWETGNYMFEETSLSDILNELAIWYDLSIDYQTKQADEETFTGSLSRSLSIEKLIQLIERTNYLTLELKGKTLIVKDKDRLL